MKEEEWHNKNNDPIDHAYKIYSLIVENNKNEVTSRESH